MVKTVMFDLDGTLAHFEFEEFFRAYIDKIVENLSDVVEPKAFMPALMASVEAMVSCEDPEMTNRDVFVADFFPRIGRSESELMPLFDAFYLDDDGFPGIKQTLGVTPHPSARAMLEGLIEREYEVVIATNPIFPLEAIEERMRWAGVHGLPYALVTSYETSHFCKPNIKYYEEIMSILGKSPKECLMVGNDTWEDLIAGDLGITTYLVEDFVLDRDTVRRDPDYRGSFDELVEFLLEENFL
ncbi:MAG: HAD family hydrolase [Firmicutes bacterium]|nr:HAD family hydrolase [Bacillota bacterium]MDD4792840.1 HAD family hydrolase [Bacillota bacterium]